MKRVLTLLAVIFTLCTASSNAAAQTSGRNQSVYVYCIVDFHNTKILNEWKVKMSVDFGQSNYTKREHVVDKNGYDRIFNSEIAGLNWLGMQGWEFVSYPTLNEGDSVSEYYMRLNVTGMSQEEINETLSVFYNPKKSDTTIVQNRDGLF